VLAARATGLPTMGAGKTQWGKALVSDPLGELCWLTLGVSVWAGRGTDRYQPLAKGSGRQMRSLNHVLNSLF